MHTNKADWQGFSEYLIEELLDGKKGVVLNIDDVEVGVYKHTPAARFSWWWDSHDNPAHPQYKTFFHRLLRVTPVVNDGKVEKVRFELGVKNVFSKNWFRLQYLTSRAFTPHNLGRGVHEFTDFLEDELQSKKELRLSTDTIKIGMRLHGETVDSWRWWRDEVGNAHRILSDELNLHHIAAEPRANDEHIEEVFFRPFSL